MHWKEVLITIVEIASLIGFGVGIVYLIVLGIQKLRNRDKSP